VILFTLVVQGLTLPVLIGALGVRESGEEERNEELRGRLAIADAALGRIDELSGAEWTNDESIERVRALYESRRRRFKVQAGTAPDEDGIEERSLQYQRLMHRPSARPWSSCATGARCRARWCAGWSSSSTSRSRGWRSDADPRA
jgi:CPA1 family monovalent cation:H+ antiporter